MLQQKTNYSMANPPTKTFPNATCTFCGCLCDDIELSVTNNTITRAKNACVLGKKWFLNSRPQDLPPAFIDQQAATVEAAIERAANILANARCPIIYGLSDTSCEAQQTALALADRIGACVDTTASACHAPSTMALQNIGEATCSLGEVKNRADLVIFWGSDPLESHPRHWGRYSATPRGLFQPRGAEGRTIVVVDIRESQSAKAADIFLKVNPAKDFEALWILRGLVKGLTFTESDVEETGIPLQALQDLAKRMRECKFGMFFFGMGLALTGGRYMNVEAAFLLVRDLNAYTRFYAKPMRGRGNITGVDNVLCWQTGYPFAVSLQRGYPRYGPGEFTTVEMLEAGEADAALIVGADILPILPESARQNLERIPFIVVDTIETPSFQQAAVAFRTATYGINTPGTAYRMDDIPLSLSPVNQSAYPADEAVFHALEARVRTLQSEPLGRPSQGRGE
ncbi:formylmethanofuran dehydrogenase subunit B [soil metagenome]